QATRLLAELDGAAPQELREEAATVLTKAGHRALSREAFRSARKLLLRAVELAPTLERRYLAGRAAWRLTDFPAVLVEMGDVAAARDADRKDLEALAIHGLVNAYVSRLETSHAVPLLERAMELAEESGSLFSRAAALTVKGNLELLNECPADAEADFTAARELY